MSAVLRPTYYERQILGAADLDAQVEYSRRALARHEREQHSWGVVRGLELEKAAAGFEIKAGMFVDGSGRQVVLDVDRQVPHQEFESSGVFAASDTDETWFPVFIIGVDELQRPLPFRREQCAAEGSTRVREGYDVVFQRPGAELALAEKPPPAIESGPGGAQGLQSPESWPVLVGYVQWDPTKNEIKAAESKGERAPRYAGVYADTVAARGGSITIRTVATPESGKAAVKLQDSEALLQVGTLQQNGKINALLTLNDKGDLTVIGKLKGTLAAGSLVAESGIASDGGTIGLPAGVTEKQVADGKAEVHVLVSPLVDAGAAPDPARLWIATPLDCSVDAARTVRCRVRWLELDFAAVGGPQIVDRPASCTYLIVANVKQE